jgi:hypothetical protein
VTPWQWWIEPAEWWEFWMPQSGAIGGVIAGISFNALAWGVYLTAVSLDTRWP